MLIAQICLYVRVQLFIDMHNFSHILRIFLDCVPGATCYKLTSRFTATAVVLFYLEINSEALMKCTQFVERYWRPWLALS